MGALIAFLPLLIPVIERLIPPIMAMIRGVNHPDLSKPLSQLLSGIDFNALLEASRKKRKELEATIPELG